MEKDPTAGLQLNVTNAAKVREMCQTPGFKVLQEVLDKKVKAVSRQMIDVKATDEDVLRFRREGQVWVALQKLLTEILLTGQISARNIDNLKAPDDQSGQAEEK